MLFSHKKILKSCHLQSCGATVYYAKWNKSVRERQIPNDLTHLWNVRKKRWTYGKREKKRREEESETSHKRHLRRETKSERWGGGWARQVMGIKEGICCNEQWVLYVTDESLTSTPETYILHSMSTNYDLNFKK